MVLHDALGEREDGKWAAFEVALIVSRQNGKGAILEARELAGLFLFDEKLILHSAHEFKTAAEAFRRVLALVENTDDLRKRVKKVQIGHGDEGIELLNGARLRFVARSTGSGRGFSGDLNLLDEAYALTAAQIEALLPTMSARENPQLWYTSSPPLDSMTGLPLFAVRKRGIAGEPGLAYMDFGAEGELSDLSKVDLDDRTLWRSCNPAYGIRIGEETIARERAAMTAAGFARERLGIWPMDPEQAGGGAIPIALWTSLHDMKSKRSGDIALGVDLAVMHDYGAINVYGKRKDDLGHGQLIDYRSGTAWIVSRLADAKRELDPIGIGMGRGTYEALKKALNEAGMYAPHDLPEKVLKERGDDKPRRGDILVCTGIDMAAACSQIINATRQRTYRVVPAQPLDDAIAGGHVKTNGDSMAWARKDSRADICPIGGLTVARFCYETWSYLFANKDDSKPEPFFAWA